MAGVNWGARLPDSGALAILGRLDTSLNILNALSCIVSDDKINIIYLLLWIHVMLANCFECKLMFCFANIGCWWLLLIHTRFLPEMLDGNHRWEQTEYGNWLRLPSRICGLLRTNIADIAPLHGIFEDDFPFRSRGCVSSLEGKYM